MKPILTTLLCLFVAFYSYGRDHKCTVSADTFVTLYGKGPAGAEKLISKCFIFQWTDTLHGVVHSSFRRNYSPKKIGHDLDMFCYDIFDVYFDSVALTTTNRKTFLKYKKDLLSFGFKLKSKSETGTVYLRNEFAIITSKETHDQFNVYKILLRKG